MPPVAIDHNSNDHTDLVLQWTENYEKNYEQLKEWLEENGSQNKQLCIQVAVRTFQLHTVQSLDITNTALDQVEDGDIKKHWSDVCEIYKKVLTKPENEELVEKYVEIFAHFTDCKPGSVALVFGALFTTMDQYYVDLLESNCGVDWSFYENSSETEKLEFLDNLAIFLHKVGEENKAKSYENIFSFAIDNLFDAVKDSSLMAEAANTILETCKPYVRAPEENKDENEEEEEMNLFESFITEILSSARYNDNSDFTTALMQKQIDYITDSAFAEPVTKDECKGKKEWTNPLGECNCFENCATFHNALTNACQALIFEFLVQSQPEKLVPLASRIKQQYLNHPNSQVLAAVVACASFVQPEFSDTALISHLVDVRMSRTSVGEASVNETLVMGLLKRLALHNKAALTSQCVDKIEANMAQYVGDYPQLLETIAENRPDLFQGRGRGYYITLLADSAQTEECNSFAINGVLACRATLSADEADDALDIMLTEGMQALNSYSFKQDILEKWQTVAAVHPSAVEKHRDFLKQCNADPQLRKDVMELQLILHSACKSRTCTIQ